MQIIKCEKRLKKPGRIAMELNENLAEFVGILLGDGSITTDYQNRLKISFHSEEQKYTDLVRNLMIDLFQEKPIFKKRKGENTADLFIFKKAIINKLLDLGLEESPKWNRARIPSQFLNSSFELAVLRGLFDTDGSVVLANNNGILYPRLEIKICPAPMQKQVITILERRGFKFGAYKIGKGKVRIQMNGKSQLKKWLDLVGTNNPKHIEKAKKVL